jgi:uncharacterized membrane protein
MRRGRDTSGVYSDSHMNGGDWVVMGVWMTFLVIVVLVAIWVIARWTTAASAQSPTHGGAQRRSTAREILDESLARGDITIDEYEKRRGAIERSTTGRSE